MNHLFIIQAHSQLILLRNLVSLLAAPNHFFLIHIDKKSRFLLDNPIMKDINQIDNVEVMCYKSVNWGGANQFFLTLELLEKADVAKYDFVHLLSGVDMPLRTNQIFDTFFEDTKYKGFFLFDSSEEAESCARKRLGRYYLCDSIDVRKCNFVQKILISALEHSQNVIERFGIVIRKPLELKVYKGAQWFSISSSIAKYIVDYCHNNKEYVRRFKWTSCCDEMFFHIIVMNSPFAEYVCKNDLRYIDWNAKKEGETLPRVLDETDYDAIVNSDCLFCRKLDAEKSKMLIDNITVHITNGTK